MINPIFCPFLWVVLIESELKAYTLALGMFGCLLCKGDSYEEIISHVIYSLFSLLFLVCLFVWFMVCTAHSQGMLNIAPCFPNYVFSSHKVLESVFDCAIALRFLSCREQTEVVVRVAATPSFYSRRHLCCLEGFMRKQICLTFGHH